MASKARLASFFFRLGPHVAEPENPAGQLTVAATYHKSSFARCGVEVGP